MNAYKKDFENAIEMIDWQNTMLKQQADRIAELEKTVSKPVAWIRSGDDQLSLVKEKDDGYMQWKPLYTHPHKELSDEEIQRIAEKHLKAFAQFIGAGEVCYEGEIEFARAIIKASRGEE
jgi:hypothetical protein